MMAELMAFTQALEQSEGGKRHVLLGNGFAQGRDKLSASNTGIALVDQIREVQVWG